MVEGVRCSACGYPAAQPLPRCPLCGAPVARESFGPEGRVWSSTVVHVPLPGREVPYGLAYVDLDDGPRVLAHSEAATPLPIGARVQLAGMSRDGDVIVAAIER